MHNTISGFYKQCGQSLHFFFFFSVKYFNSIFWCSYVPKRDEEFLFLTRYNEPLITWCAVGFAHRRLGWMLTLFIRLYIRCWLYRWIFAYLKIIPRYLRTSLESFKIWRSCRIKTMKWSEKVANKEILEHGEEKRRILNPTKRGKDNWIWYIVRWNYLWWKFSFQNNHLAGRILII